MTATPDPLISVVIPVFRDRSYVERCLRALEGQTLDRALFEVLVVDNAPEGIPALELAQPPPGFRRALLRESAPGSYAARNRALPLARGAYIAFTDDDCTPSKEWLAHALEACAPERIVAGRVRLSLRGARPTLFEAYDRLTGLRQRDFVHRLGFGATANLVAPRALFERVGGFNAGLLSGGDKEWCRRATRAGAHLVYESRAEVAHPALDRFRDLARRHRRIAGGEATMHALKLDLGSAPGGGGFRKRRFYSGLLCLRSARATLLYGLHRVIRSLYHFERWRCSFGGHAERR
jgi:glycosyltransferase involved in cell wall biosynthesis